MFTASGSGLNLVHNHVNLVAQQRAASGGSQPVYDDEGSERGQVGACRAGQNLLRHSWALLSLMNHIESNTSPPIHLRAPKFKSRPT